jgi:hypothetical protein
LTDYYVNWDVAESRALDDAQRYAATTYDLTKAEDRARCWLAHCRDSYGGGPGLWHQVYDFDRDSMDAYLDRGEETNERNQRQLAHFREEFNALAANDPFWGQLNIAGVQRSGVQRNGK